MKKNHLARAIHLLAVACAGQSAAAQTAPANQPGFHNKPDTAAPVSVEIQGVRLREKAGQLNLSREEMQRMPGSAGDPMKALQALPGVAVGDDSSSEPAVRGARPSDNAYIVDFLPVGYLFHVGGFASVFNPDLIRRFDMYSAAWSPEYPDAVGAVFDISLRSPRSDRIGGKFDISLLGANALIEGPLGDDKRFFLAARRSYFDLAVKTVEDKDEGVTVTVPIYSDVQGRFIWDSSPGNRLRFDFSGANDRVGFNLKAGSKAALRDPVLVGNSTDKQSYVSSALVWEAEVLKGVNNTLALGRMDVKQLSRVGQAGSIDGQSRIAYLKDEVQWLARGGHSLTLGGQVQRRQVDLALDFQFARCTEFDPNCDITSASRLKSDQNSTQNLADVYAADRWQFSKTWLATGGLRATYDSKRGQTLVEPRVGLEWTGLDNTTVSAGVGQHSQLPAIEEALRDIGNPNLKHLASTHSVLGVQHKVGAAWLWRAEIYNKQFKNYAVADPLLNYRNGASGTAQGLELLVKKEPAGSKLSGFASLSLSRSRRQIDGSGASFPFEFDQPVIANLVLAYKQSDRWSFGAKWSYHTGSPYTPVVGTTRFADGRVRPLYGTLNSQRVPSYHRLDLRADVQWSANRSSYFELINAYNRKNVAGYSYNADYTQRDTVYQLPVLLSAGFKYSF